MFELITTAGNHLSRQHGVVTRISDVHGVTEVSYDSSARAHAFYLRERNQKLKAPFYAFRDSPFLRWFLS